MGRSEGKRSSPWKPRNGPGPGRGFFLILFKNEYVFV